ncbi:Streptothricin hydrolase [Paenibacillus plantiphilus]|uniref:Streptothricin hydrolase n=1 Tax=Paenibacillus plantiphilus TaxID=2905650 RepID=A0ABN8GPW6_9BACL|nr:cysteine hydrolase family protein [Paenibacillus plantiphilus]CAH1213162.1 Streptothricin hydrolase [Paenibacillus plantiphilus]
MSKALLIIDMQVMPFIWKDYGGKPLYQEEKLLENTKQLIDNARKANSPVFYVMFTERQGSLRSENEPLWQAHEQIAPLGHDPIIIKYYADSFLDSELNHQLRDQGIDTLVICGVQTEYCVDTTVKSSYSHGYKVELAEDCHSTYDSDHLTAEQIINHHNSILTQFATMVRSSEVQF